MEIPDEKIAEIENKVRDLINLVSVMNEEEVEGGTKKIEDESAAQLKEKLQEIANLLGKEE